MTKNFVSISAVSDREQLSEINRIYEEEGFQFPIAIGYQVSNKSINKGTQNPRQPKFADLGDLDKETRDYGFITAVHYYTKDNDTIVRDLERVIESGVNPSLALVQFSTLPPSKEVLNNVNKMGFNIIFKVAVSNKQSSQGGYSVWRGEEVQDVESGNIEPLVKQVYDRREVLDYVMFNPSHGTNLELDLNEDNMAIKFGRKITSSTDLDHLGLVYAGGIKPNNVQRVTRDLKTFFPEKFSIDIESGVRTDDELDLDLVRDYLMNYRNT